MFEAKGINFNEITQTAPLREGTAAGRGFAVSGGVAEAVREAISHIDPDREVKTACAQEGSGLPENAHACQGRQVRRVSARGHGVSGRLRRGRRYAPADREGGPSCRNYTAQAEEKSATETKYEATLPLLLEDEEDAE